MNVRYLVELRALSDWGGCSQAVPVGNSWLFVVSFAWVTRFSSRSAHGRRMMGSGRRGVSICFTTLKAFYLQALDSQRDRLAYRPHGNDPAHPFGQIPLACPSISSGRSETSDRAGLLAEAELRFVAPHAVQHDGKLASDGDARSRHAATLGDLRGQGAPI